MTLKDILSRARTQRILPARHTAIYLAHRMSGANLEEISRRFGGRDHALVTMVCRSVQREVMWDSLRMRLLKDMEAVIWRRHRRYMLH